MPATCARPSAVSARTLGEEIRPVRGDDEDPPSREHICPQAVALQGVHVLLLAVFNTRQAEGLARPGRLESFVNGLDEFWQSVWGVTPETDAPVTGVEPEAARALAREFAAAKGVVWSGRVRCSAGSASWGSPSRRGFSRWRCWTSCAPRQFGPRVNDFKTALLVPHVHFTQPTSSAYQLVH